MKSKITQYLSEIELSVEENYKHLLKYATVENIECWINKKNSFFDSDGNLGLLPQKGFVGILNTHFYGNSICEDNFNEIKEIINSFSEEYFHFLTDSIKINDLDGVLLKFPEEINWEEFSNNQESFGEFFFSRIIPYNFWIGENWVRQVMAYFSDIYIPIYKKTIDFPSELIVVREENFNVISKIYSKKYGKIAPIMEHKDFFKKIFESEFNYLLSDNIYITSNSIDYIKKQL